MINYDYKDLATEKERDKTNDKRDAWLGLFVLAAMVFVSYLDSL